MLLASIRKGQRRGDDERSDSPGSSADVFRRPKGTAFVEFVSHEAAEAAVRAASKTGGRGLFLGTWAMGVSLAVNKEDARALALRKSANTRESDRRNLHLADESLVKEGSKEAMGVLPQDMAHRRRLEREKASKLASPNFSISRTRLAVHNLPREIDERALKRLFIDAVRKRATKQNPRVKQVKILREEAKAGGARSRGAAFIEFEEHQHALVALRALNNNPEPFGPERRPIVEFAIENQLVVKRREEARARAAKGSGANQQPPPGAADPDKKDNKGGAAGEVAPSAAGKRKERNRLRKERRLAKAAEKNKEQQGVQVQDDGKAENGGRAPRPAGGGANGQIEAAAGKGTQKQQQDGKGGREKGPKKGMANGKGGGPNGSEAAVTPTETRSSKKRKRKREAAAAGARQLPSTQGGIDAQPKSGAPERRARGTQNLPSRMEKPQAAARGVAKPGGPDTKGKKKYKEEEMDKLDRMVAEYKTKYFASPAGGGGGGGKRKAKATPAISKPAIDVGSLRRWFE